MHQRRPSADKGPVGRALGSVILPQLAHQGFHVVDQARVLGAVRAVFLVEPLHQGLELADDRHARFAVGIVLLPHIPHQGDGVVGKGVGLAASGHEAQIARLQQRLQLGHKGFVRPLPEVELLPQGPCERLQAGGDGRRGPACRIILHLRRPLQQGGIPAGGVPGDIAANFNDLRSGRLNARRGAHAV